MLANDQVAESLHAMRASYGVWYDTGLTAPELASSTARQINAYTGSFTDPASANGLALATLLNERPIQELSGTDGLLRGQTVAGINGFIKERFPRPDRLLAVVVTPTAAALAADCIAKSRTQVASCRR